MNQHAGSKKTYYAVFVALMVLLFASVAAAQWNLGPWNVVVALAISLAKAILVMLFFMHLVESDRLVRIVAVSGILWLAFLAVLVFSDYRTRPWDEERQVHYRAAPLDRPYSEGEPSSSR